MEINPSKMDMETADLNPTEWFQKFIEISREKFELSRKSSDDRVRSIDVDEYDYQEFEDNDDDKKFYINTRKTQYGLCMTRMAPLFASHPRLEKICKDWKNEFLPSGFTKYTCTFSININDHSVDELHGKANDLEYLINFFGRNLTYLDVTEYPYSEIMPIINANCPNLETFYIKFRDIMSQDFENCFSNMSHLKTLKIYWQCENSTLPMTLAKSFEKIGETLKVLYLLCILERTNFFSPDSLASVFPRLIALNFLSIRNFELSQLFLQSIGEIKNLADLRLHSFWPEKHSMFDTRINMYPIGNLKNLEKLEIDFDYGVRDELLINLGKNAKKLKNLQIVGTHITDTGMRAIDNLQELVYFYLGSRTATNEFITDESIRCLFNKNLKFMKLIHCIKITDKGVSELLENLPNLFSLYITNTKVTDRTVIRIYKLKDPGEKPRIVYDDEPCDYY
ncbi:uncharacterized protein LOC122857907 [Aphidius gifuensis]|uniref:uncharacterized protein LOC122857907 n=1 Tax=Aphidius gifuensis TaxID=684658 RepID=UPI001CDBED79|nr:uncharacterized protein LOC122857907 [Aphidius gifuensis]